MMMSTTSGEDDEAAALDALLASSSGDDGPAPRARTAQRVVSMGGFYAEDAERGRCALRASRRWRARGDDDDDEDGDKNASRNDVGTVPIGVIHGRLSAVLWPPHAIGFVARED